MLTRCKNGFFFMGHSHTVQLAIRNTRYVMVVSANSLARGAIGILRESVRGV